MKQVATHVRSVSPGEVILSEGYFGMPAMYVIKDGQVELSVTRDDAKVVLGTLGKGQFFGESVLLGNNPRHCTAKALTFCELQVIEGASLQAMLEGAPPLLKHMLRALIASAVKKDEHLATHENMQSQPDIVTYAHILVLMAAPEAGAQHLRRDREMESSLPTAEVLRRCRDITGHSRRHVVATLKHMAMLNLVTLDPGRAAGGGGGPALDAASLAALGGAQTLRFQHGDIAPRAREMARHNLDDKLHSENDLIDLTDLAALTGVDRQMLLRKLTQDEVAEELFNFRRSAVLRFIAERGRDYFAKRQGSGQLQTVEDLGAVDKRILFEALNGLDEVDLAKLLQHTSDAGVRQRLLGCLSKARREEIEGLLDSGTDADPDELQLIESTLMEAVRALRRPAVRAPIAPSDGQTAGAFPAAA